MLGIYTIYVVLVECTNCRKRTTATRAAAATSAAAAVAAASPAACAEISVAAQFFSHLTAVGARQAHYVP